MARVDSGEERLAKASTPERVHQRFRQTTDHRRQTDDRRICDSKDSNVA